MEIDFCEVVCQCIMLVFFGQFFSVILNEVFYLVQFFDMQFNCDDVFVVLIVEYVVFYQQACFDCLMVDIKQFVEKLGFFGIDFFDDVVVVQVDVQGVGIRFGDLLDNMFKKSRFELMK